MTTEPTPKNDRKDKDLGLVEWDNQEPFLDPIEASDPRVARWRDIIRRAYSGKKHNENRAHANGDDTDAGITAGG